jgi:hypothetical protein
MGILNIYWKIPIMRNILHQEGVSLPWDKGKIVSLKEWYIVIIKKGNFVQVKLIFKKELKIKVSYHLFQTS